MGEGKPLITESKAASSIAHLRICGKTMSSYCLMEKDELFAKFSDFTQKLDAQDQTIADLKGKINKRRLVLRV